MVSGILGFGIRNTAIGVQSPTINNWNAESKFHWKKMYNPVIGILNQRRGIQNQRLSWIPLHGANFFLVYSPIIEKKKIIKQHLCTYRLVKKPSPSTTTLTLDSKSIISIPFQLCSLHSVAKKAIFSFIYSLPLEVNGTFKRLFKSGSPISK